jgi:hypothetical protein
MQQIALNVIAIGIFVISLFSMLAPILHISPLVPVVITLFLMAILSIDTGLLQNRGVSIFLEFIASKEHRQRVIHHEAGHFLIAYLLDIPVLDYSLSTLEAWRKGQRGSGGVILNLEQLKSKEAPVTIFEKLYTIWMAGIAAEQIVYQEAQGGQDDREQLYALLQKKGDNKNSYRLKERTAILQAKDLLKKNSLAYDTIVTLMEQGSTIEQCYQSLNLLKESSNAPQLSLI